MARRVPKRYRSKLDISHFTDDNRHGLVDGIKKNAPGSSIYKGSPAVQTCVDNIGKKGDALRSANTVVAEDKSKLKADLGDEAEKRSDLDGEVRTLVALVANEAQSAADVQAVGLPYEDPVPVVKKNPPEAPSGIDVKYPKKGHGKATTSAKFTGKGRPQFNAETSLDGTNYTAITGHGKTRTLTGAPATKIWIRYATVRGELQSPWCTPVLVTLP
jgi:hypothetical protein